ncbi:glycosyltransferase [Chengkuizengella sp. SCS-71B]|uniref:glycosyltransferase n=1 Tax=Chengkuizengella sp. SCS-71B TaxID=3115290 RepID=UPI0032C24600
MSCYKNDNPEFLRIAIESSFIEQTLRPDEFLLIVDGPVSKELENIIAEFENRYKYIFKVHKLKENKGLGNALRVGVLNCSNEYIIRMDSDDVSRKDRFEKLISYAKRHPECSVIGSYTAEFEIDVNYLTSVRVVKEHHNDIVQQSKSRSPVSHVSVLFKKKAVLGAGNYMDFPLYEDYYLWIRMLKEQYVFHNIPEILVFVRTDKNRYKRKGNKTYIKSTLAFQRYLREVGFINGREYFINKNGRLLVAMIPPWIRKFVYVNLLRRKPTKI